LKTLSRSELRKKREQRQLRPIRAAKRPNLPESGPFNRTVG
jgi:hypothetical protein